MSYNSRYIVLIIPNASKAQLVEIFQLLTTWFINKELINKESQKHTILIK
jgi:hypothetical protein